MQDEPSPKKALTGSATAPLREGEDYYYDGPYLVFTEHYHLKRGTCCDSGCRHCPYRSASNNDNSSQEPA